MITKVSIRNYRMFENFTLECREGLNIIVGDNDAGKSTVLEAIHLALTKKLKGRFVDMELSPYLFNRNSVRAYVEGIQNGSKPEPPSINIELCLADDRSSLQEFKGTNNLDGADCIGIRLDITFDDDFRSEYEQLLADPSLIRTIPIEYYKVSWYSFAYQALNPRTAPVRLSYIDATTIRLQAGTDYYMQNIINAGLDEKDRAGLAIAFRQLKEHFSEELAIKAINERLAKRQGEITDKPLTVAMDLSQKGSWETSLTPHVDDIPYLYIGKGEQNILKIMFALDRRADESHVVLIEEPENHLSFSTLNQLLRRITTHCDGKQIFITTHSAYVLNKLGIGNLVLLHSGSTSFLTELEADTQEYFRKVSGYDTLRLVLAKRSILVEGPSDDLIVQKAYQMANKRLPIEDGIDVICVRGLSFLRFLEIARSLRIPTAVVTDNDGDFATRVKAKYADFVCPTIKICADQNDDLTTLEDHLLAVNSRDVLNKIFGRSYSDDHALLAYMKDNKTECALRLFDTNEVLTMPAYINDAIA